MIELKDKSLLRPDAAFINGEWISGDTTFDVFGKSTISSFHAIES